MKIFGIDFTSVPGNRKPITCAHCSFDGHSLHLEEFIQLATFREFEALLVQDGPWVAGIDFPFGQPRRLIENIGWPKSWSGYVRHVAGMSKQEFVDVLGRYRNGRQKGDKQHLRRTDKLAGSRSHMMLYGVPVGKMFFEGANRLLNSGACILPCRPTVETRIIIEAYPALVARRWISRRSYKIDQKSKQTPEREAARVDIVKGLRSPEIRSKFGFDIQFSQVMADQCVQDGTGDKSDSLLCAVQAGWSSMNREENYGIPVDCDPLEGWIVDPLL